MSLASCGEPAAVSNVAANEAEAPAPAPAQANLSNAAAPAAAAIPEPLRGRWGLTAEDCTSTRGDAKGLLEVTENGLRFYESRAALGRIAEQGPARIAADFDFEGEGMTWQRHVILETQDGGRTLSRRETGADAMTETLRYERCES